MSVSPQTPSSDVRPTRLSDLYETDPALADRVCRELGWPTRAERENAEKKATRSAPVRTTSTGQVKTPDPAKPTRRVSKKAIPVVRFSK